MTDTIADLMTRLRNGQLARKSGIYVRKSKFAVLILDILEREGFIRGYKFIVEKPRDILVLLKYNRYGHPVIRKCQKVSKKSSRVYASAAVLWKLNQNIGIFILSTTKGVISDRYARKHRVGGEVLVYIE